MSSRVAQRLVGVSLCVLIGGLTHAAGRDPDSTPGRIKRIQSAIKRGVTFLLRDQLPHGEFPIYWFVARDRRWVFDSTPYGTAVILYSLRLVHDHRITRLKEKAIQFLLHEMDPPGRWRYWSTRNPRHDKIVPDIDDTVVVGLSLLAHWVSFPHDLDALLHDRTRDKLFPTFSHHADQSLTQDDIERDWVLRGLLEHYLDERPDCVVNAHALAYVAHEGRRLPEICQYLIQVAQDPRAAPAHSLYYASPYAFTYAVSVALREGASCLQPAVAPIVAFVAETYQVTDAWGNALDTALALNTLLNLDYTGDLLNAGLSVLLSQQQRNGSWPREEYWGSTKDVDTAYGSEGLTTGFAVEALGHYLKRLELQ